MASSAALDDDYPKITRRRAGLVIAILVAMLVADIASVVAVLFGADGARLSLIAALR